MKITSLFISFMVGARGVKLKKGIIFCSGQLIRHQNSADSVYAPEAGPT